MSQVDSQTLPSPILNSDMNTIQKDDVVYFVSIMDDVIQFTFSPTEKEYLRKRYVQILFSLFGKCILSQKPSASKVIANIRFVSLDQHSLYQRNSDLYIHFVTFQSKKNITTFYGISEAQLLLVLRVIITRLFKRGFLLHASSIKYKDDVYIFCGKSGAGKSTILSMLAKNKSLRAFGDDSVFIVKKNGGYFAYQTPFVEKEKWIKKTNAFGKVQCIYFLKQTNYFKIKQITNKEEIVQLLIEHIITHPEADHIHIKEVMKCATKHSFFYYLFNNLDKKKLLAEFGLYK